MSDGSLTHPTLTLVGLLLEAHAGLTRDLSRQLEREAGIPHQWFEVLLRLARSPGQRLRMSELAAQTTLTPSGLTRAVDRLEAAGLVERQACPTDRRSLYAVLTAKGRERIEAAVPTHLAHLQGVLDGIWSAQEQATFADLVRKLRDGVNPCATVGIEGSPGGDPHQP